MASFSRTAPKKERNIEYFHDAIDKIAAVTASYRDQTMKHVEYTTQMDSIMAVASSQGWTQKEIYDEIDRRSKAIGH